MQAYEGYLRDRFQHRRLTEDEVLYAAVYASGAVTVTRKGWQRVQEMMAGGKSRWVALNIGTDPPFHLYGHDLRAILGDWAPQAPATDEAEKS